MSSSCTSALAYWPARNNSFGFGSKTTTRMPRVPTSAEGAIWRDQHSHFANSYRDVYGYWVPQQGQFSYQAYTDAIKRGDSRLAQPEPDG